LLITSLPAVCPPHAQIKDNGIVLFCYPRANTPGCTNQAKGLNEKAAEMAAAGYKVTLTHHHCTPEASLSNENINIVLGRSTDAAALHQHASSPCISLSVASLPGQCQC
jgi:hypothetical protein